MYPGWSARDNYAIHKRRKKRKIKQGAGDVSPTKQQPNSSSGSPCLTSVDGEMCMLEEEGGDKSDGGE